MGTMLSPLSGSSGARQGNDVGIALSLKALSRCVDRPAEVTELIWAHRALDLVFDKTWTKGLICDFMLRKCRVQTSRV
jgi:hypothetical protein